MADTGPIFTTVGADNSSATSISAEDLLNLAQNGPSPQQQQQKSEAEKKLEAEINAKKLAERSTGYSMVLVKILLVQLVAIALFAKGFLLTRPVFEDRSECSESPLGETSGSASKGCWYPKSFDRAVFVIIDALRYDFVIPSDDGLYYHNGFPYLYEMAEKHPENVFLSKFMADPPTTTLQRLKGLTTGSLPTFIDAGSNFAGTEIEEDNWIAQLDQLNKSIAFMGDDTWEKLFGKHFTETHAYDSLNVWDLHTVDNGVIEHIFPTLDNKDNWDVAIGHLLGVDHAGHRYGPNHVEMQKKLQQMDRFIRDIVEKIDDKTLLVVMGDHGMDPKGDHGGDTELELESTLWMYSKNKFFGPERNVKERTVSQIDLVPTVSLLLGLPIPFNNLGFPIREAFLGPKKKPNWDAMSKAGQLAVAQILRYMKKFGIDAGSDEAELWQKLKSLKGTQQGAELCEQFSLDVLEEFRSRWVQFDLPSIYIGLGLLVLCIGVVQIYYTNMDTIPESNSYAQFVVAAAMSGLGYAISGKDIYIAGLFAVIGVVGFSIRWIGANFKTSFTTLKSCNKWNIFATLLVLAHAASFSSNSFTIWEDRILQYLLVSFGAVMVAASFGLEDIKERTIGAWHGAMFVILSKLSSFSTLCREEQGELCKTTFYGNNSSVNSPYAIVCLVLMAFALPQIIKSFYKTTASYVASAQIWIGWGLCVSILTVAWYWVLDGFDAYSWPLPSWLSQETIHSAKQVTARILVGATLVAANFGWYTGALCVKVDVQKDPVQGKVRALILGYSNVYGSYYFLFVLNIFAAILLFNKPLAGIMLGLLIYQILALLELIDIHELKGTFIGPVILGLLGYSYFFTTGHHATIPAVQWEVGFTLTKTISFPFTHLAIALNTLGPIILTTLVGPLLVAWKSQPSKSPQQFQAHQISSLLGVVLYHSIISLVSMFCAFHLRRHLMLWKIFAPRFMLAGVTLGLVDVVAVIAAVASARVTSYINGIFT